MMVPSISLGNFHKQFFNRFEQFAVRPFFPKHFGRDHQNFVTFAPHLLDENRDLHFARTAHRKNFRVARLRDSQRADVVRISFTSRSKYGAR